MPVVIQSNTGGGIDVLRNILITNDYKIYGISGEFELVQAQYLVYFLNPRVLVL